MLTPYGKILRKIRIDRGEILAIMAGKVGVSPAYLSSIENGDREIPGDLSDKIGSKYCLSEKDLEALKKAEAEQLKTVKVNLTKEKNFSRKQTALIFARTFSDIDDDAMEKIREILKRGKENGDQ